MQCTTSHRGRPQADTAAGGCCKWRRATERRPREAACPQGGLRGISGITRMNRTELQQLSNARIEDARVLLEAHRWSGSYYLLGYAVECALKACAAARFRQDEVPEKTVINDFYTHRLDRLQGRHLARRPDPQAVGPLARTTRCCSLDTDSGMGPARVTDSAGPPEGGPYVLTQF